MSKIKVQGNASGSGTLTIEAPNTNSNRTISLPDSTGTLLDTNSSLSSSKLTGALPAIDGSALTGISTGKVLQVVNNSMLGTFSTANNTHPGTQMSDLDISITPTSTTSKILIIVHLGSVSGSGTSAFNLKRGSTLVGGGTASGSRLSAIARGTRNVNGDGNHATGVSFNYLDSPSTTSSTTYSVWLQAQSGETSYVGRSVSDSNTADSYGCRFSSYITLMEIGA